MIWRSKWHKRGVDLCPHWMPVIGNYNALSMVIEKAENSAEPNQNAFVLLGKEFYTDKEGRYAPIVAVNAPYCDHLVINCSNVAAQLFEKKYTIVDKSDCMTLIHAGFTGESISYDRMASDKQKKWRQLFKQIFANKDNFTKIFAMTKSVTG